MKTLVIGYGNNSRRDDGVGWFVIEQLATRELPGVELRTAHQLEVELAEELTDFQRVVFVDAAIPEAPLAVQRSDVVPNFQSHAVAHYLTPADVLSLCESLYDHHLEATFFSIRGQDFNFGMTMSPAVQLAAGAVVNQIAELLTGTVVELV